MATLPMGVPNTPYSMVNDTKWGWPKTSRNVTWDHHQRLGCTAPSPDPSPQWQCFHYIFDINYAARTKNAWLGFWPTRSIVSQV